MTEVKRARGVRRDTKGVSSPKMKPAMNINKGLNLVNVTVRVDENEPKEDSKQLAFIGHSVPQLVFVFTQADARGEAGQYIHSFRPIDYSDDTLEEGVALDIEETNMEMLAHFITVLTGKSLAAGLPNSLSDKEVTDISLPLAEGETKGSEVLKAYRTMYTNVMNLINANEKLPNQKFWLKLLRYIKHHVVRGGAVAIPKYVSDGYLELSVKGVEPKLEINIAKGESIVPREVSVDGGAGKGVQMAPAGGQAGAAPTDAMPGWAADED